LGTLAAGGTLADIGFTMALFMANLAFSPSLINSARLGILSAPVNYAVAGIALLVWLSRQGPPGDRIPVHASHPT
jgi:NhaA family Na+:H+ antiporter